MLVTCVTPEVQTCTLVSERPDQIYWSSLVIFLLNQDWTYMILWTRARMCILDAPICLMFYVCFCVYRGLAAAKWSFVDQTWPPVSTTGGAHEIIGAMVWCHCRSTWWGKATRCIFKQALTEHRSVYMKKRERWGDMQPISLGSYGLCLNLWYTVERNTCTVLHHPHHIVILYRTHTIVI